MQTDLSSHTVPSLAVAANTRSVQQYTNFVDEYLRFDARIDFYIRVDVLLVVVTLMVGARLLLDEMPCRLIAGTAVDVNTDQVAQDFGLAGEKLQLFFRAGANAAVVQAMTVVTPA